jgi:hypothetical protein
VSLFARGVRLAAHASRSPFWLAQLKPKSLGRRAPYARNPRFDIGNPPAPCLAPSTRRSRSTVSNEGLRIPTTSLTLSRPSARCLGSFLTWPATPRHTLRRKIRSAPMAFSSGSGAGLYLCPLRGSFRCPSAVRSVRYLDTRRLGSMKWPRSSRTRTTRWSALGLHQLFAVCSVVEGAPASLLAAAA